MYAKTNIIPDVLFVITLSLTAVTFVSFIFPIFLFETFSPFPEENINKFEFGAWSVPLFISNISILILWIFNKIKPNFFQSIVNSVLNFEISKKIAFIIIVSLLLFYTIYSFNEFFESEVYQLGDFEHVLEQVQNFPDDAGTQYTRFFLLWVSYTVFENLKVIPFLASVALLLVTYFFTTKLTGKRFAGIISLIVLLQSNIFLIFDTTASYENFLLLFYVLSLYLIFKKPALSFPTYLLALTSKNIVFALIPSSLFIVARSKIPRKSKLILFFIYLIFMITIGVYYSTLTGSIDNFTPENFFSGFSSISNSLRYDAFVVLFFVPLIFGLWSKARKGNFQAEVVLVLLANFLIIPTIISSIGGHTNEVYRIIPLVTFFAIGMGILVSNSKK